jgi:hypothetical protein
MNKEGIKSLHMMMWIDIKFKLTCTLRHNWSIQYKNKY